MVNGISSTNSTDWFALLSASRKNSTEKTGSNSTYSMGEDSVELSSNVTNRPNPLEKLINDGTITSDQASAIDQALKTAMDSGMGPGSGADPLASLVSSGTITQDQASSVKSALDAGRPEKQNSFVSNALDSLVSGGTLTQDQADAVQQALKPPNGAPPPQQAASSSSSSGSSSSSSSSTDLSNLSEDEILQLLLSGKISTQQAEEAIKELQSKDSSNSESGVKAVSGASSTGSTSSTAGSTRANPLDKLVANGMITQDQENAIQSAFRQSADTERAAKAYSAYSL
jgi:competence protein ComGC